MSEQRVGFVGYRGMVGSVLRERMEQENDFAAMDPVLLSTSQAGEAGPQLGGKDTVLGDAYDNELLHELDIIVSCQGSDYTKRVHDDLRKAGWNGYWIDSSSELRMQDSSVLVLDPVNRERIDNALSDGKKDLVGANCTVSTQLMGLSGILKSGLVEWIQPDTYQAVSGAGSEYITELLKQMKILGEATADMLGNPAASLAEIDRKASETMHSPDFPIANFGHPIAGNILPWIDSDMGNGRSREEWKAEVETNQILGTDERIAIDGTCVRVGSLRSHAQSVTMALKRDVPLDELTAMISSGNEWIDLVPNNREDTLSRLTPAAISGTLGIGVGRLRMLNHGPGNHHLSAHVVGDQLLWGAAEPLRRALNIVIGKS